MYFIQREKKREKKKEEKKNERIYWYDMKFLVTS